MPENKDLNPQLSETAVSSSVLSSEDNIINEILNKKTDNKKIKYSEIGSNDNDFKDFKSRYKFYKNYIKENLPNFSFEEIVKIHSNYQKIKDTLYSFNGFDTALFILGKETEKRKCNHIDKEGNSTVTHIGEIDERYCSKCFSLVYWDGQHYC